MSADRGCRSMSACVGWLCVLTYPPCASASILQATVGITLYGGWITVDQTVVVLLLCSELNHLLRHFVQVPMPSALLPRLCLLRHSLPSQVRGAACTADELQKLHIKVAYVVKACLCCVAGAAALCS